MNVAVRGRDAAAEAYLVETGGLLALVPECLMEGLRPGARLGHQEAYEWIARHRFQIARAVAQRAAGEVPRAPFDLITVQPG
jgi:hypothetical protein